ncbi:ABC-2 transporter permease [Thermoactinomyces sp. DSM 45892]|uniref:ABC-2 transporter permease n=1 Tax=Thermoactinomyces sp. DSM 45892 TaxID=1882753 RepID=UPI0008965976|nr:ABC-2 transporter permease [Thermoactinomyces sp. DSM 45892]SDY37452.1 ABC-2 family transporter protein [Thermoactinomyces sp. DSM 45892]
MKGLLLNQYYSNEKSIKHSIVLSLIITTILLLLPYEPSLRLAGFLPFITIVSPILEGLKFEAMSGWNKFLITLPLNRSRVIQSYYLFFSILLFIGFCVATVSFIVANFFSKDIFTGLALTVFLKGIGMTLIMGGVTFPLTHHLGVEKAEKVMMISMVTGLGMLMMSGWLYEETIGSVMTNMFPRIHADLPFSILFLVISLLTFIASYMVAIRIYEQKEF